MPPPALIRGKFLDVEGHRRWSPVAGSRHGTVRSKSFFLTLPFRRSLYDSRPRQLSRTRMYVNASFGANQICASQEYLSF
jgi:hypothetical protein